MRGKYNPANNAHCTQDPAKKIYTQWEIEQDTVSKKWEIERVETASAFTDKHKEY